MKKMIVVTLVAVLLLAGCGGAQSQVPAAASKAPAAAPTQFTITFSNASDYIFNEIYISPTASNEWGDELLGSTSVLKASGSIDVVVPTTDFSSYDILVVDEDKDEYHFTRVPLQNGSEVAIYFGDSGLAADVYDAGGALDVTVGGTLAGAGGDTGADTGAAEPQQPVATGTGYDTNGQYSFTVYNESDYRVYAIHVGVAGASAEYDLDILPEILEPGADIVVSGSASEGDWQHTEWTLYVTDVDGDTSASYEPFNPWTVSYVDINWDANNGGYVCYFSY